ncbi:MAG: 3-isopropylmalate dehydrogenase [Acidobacteriota bacterium]|nr:MAG: 3-isopropylmalate dehydrogenase [Acidobacteriota bacterium]
MKSDNVAVLPGDGIGPEIIKEAIRVLEKISEKLRFKLHYQFEDVGGAAIDKHGDALPDRTLRTCEGARAILFGAVGGAKWDVLPPEERPERAALLKLRKHFDLYANLRPAIVFKALADASTLKREVIGDGFDIMVVRELTSGIYFGRRELDADYAVDEARYTKGEIERISRLAFDIARKRKRKLTLVDKANILATSILWRSTVQALEKEYPDVEVNFLYVDNAAMQLVRDPRQFDVMLCENMFGDILSDEAAMLTGSLGMLPSASIGGEGFGMYEPAGGSAPDIAGKGVANPIAQILSAAMMLKYSLGREKGYEMIMKSVTQVLEKGYRTQDIMEDGKTLVSTEEMGAAVCEELEKA